MTTRTCTYWLYQAPDWHICSRPAKFVYNGIVNPDFPVGQLVHDLCIDHAKMVLHTMESALKDRIANMRCIVQDKQSIRCNKCKSATRIDTIKKFVAPRPATDVFSGQTGDIAFCPYCGANNIAVYEPTMDLWELIAAELDLPVALTVRVHAMWVEDAYTTTNFITYMEDIIAEVEQSLDEQAASTTQ